MPKDPEIAAMEKVEAALIPLTAVSRQRVLKWVDSRLGAQSILDTQTDGLRIMSETLDAIAGTAKAVGISPAHMRVIAEEVLRVYLRQHDEREKGVTDDAPEANESTDLAPAG